MTSVYGVVKCASTTGGGDGGTSCEAVKYGSAEYTITAETDGIAADTRKEPSLNYLKGVHDDLWSNSATDDGTWPAVIIMEKPDATTLDLIDLTGLGEASPLENPH